MRILAPAKVNLFLSVGARRANGLHEVESVMQCVSLADEVVVEPGPELTVEVDPPGAAPPGEENLVARAARALAASAGVEPGARILVRKRIPVAAGLGGGSADAAAALVGLNELWGRRISKKALAKVGAAVGSDVPFCVSGGTAAVRGAGEVVAPLPVGRPVWWVIAVPAGSLSTADVYDRVDELGGGPGVADPWEVADALARGDAGRLAGSLRNDLTEAAASLLPTPARERLMEAGALGAVQSGSGPAWCALARDEAHTREIASKVSDAFARVEVAHSVNHGPKIFEK